jgi:hypothetical protein
MPVGSQRCPNPGRSWRLAPKNTSKVGLTGISGEKTPNDFAKDRAASRNLIGLHATEKSPWSRYKKPAPIPRHSSCLLAFLL